MNLKLILLVSIEMSKDGYSLRYAKLKKGTPVNKVNFQIAESIEKLIELSKNIPVYFHVRGFGVLTRQIENLPNYKDGLIVSGDKSEFYFSSFDNDDNLVVSFIRKSLIEDLILSFKNSKSFVFELHVGPIPLLQLYNDYDFVQADFKIEFNQEGIVSIERNDNESENRTDKYYLESFIQAFNWDIRLKQAFDPELTIAVQKDYNEYKRFVNLGIGILIFFLLSLTANYFYVNHLNQKSADLEAGIQSFQENLAMIDRLEQEKLRKLSLVDNSGIQTDNFISFYLDEIGTTVPSDIQFQTLEIFPLTEPLKPKRKVEPNIHNIVIQGTCKNSKILDDWIENLEDKSWITSIEVINYIRLSGEKSNFHILIKLAV